MNSTITDMAVRPKFGIGRRVLLVTVVLLTPALSMAELAGMPINIGLADFVMIVAAAGLLWRVLSGHARLPLFSLFCFMMAALIASLLLNADLTLKARGPVSVVVESVKIVLLWLYFYVGAELVSSRRDLVLMLKTWMLSSALVGVTGVYGSFAYQLMGLQTPFASDYRAHGTFGDANFFSMHMGVSFFLALFYREVSGKRNWWFYPVMALYAACILLAASRSAMLAFVVALFVRWFLSTSYRKKAAAGIGVVVLVLLLVTLPGKRDLLESNPFTARLATTTFDYTQTDRGQLWENALKGFLSAPVLGVGYGNLPYFNPTLTGRMQEAHNTYLSIASETGVIGLAAFLVAILYFPVALVRDARRVGPEAGRRAYPALVAAFAVIIFAAIPVNCENYRGLWLLMAVAFSFRELYPTGRNRSEDESSQPVGDRRLDAVSAG